MLFPAKKGVRIVGRGTYAVLHEVNNSSRINRSEKTMWIIGFIFNGRHSWTHIFFNWT